MTNLKDILDPADKLRQDTLAIVKKNSEKCYDAFVDRIATCIYDMRNQGVFCAYIEYDFEGSKHLPRIISDLQELKYSVRFYEGTARKTLIVKWKEENTID